MQGIASVAEVGGKFGAISGADLWLIKLLHPSDIIRSAVRTTARMFGQLKTDQWCICPAMNNR